MPIDKNMYDENAIYRSWVDNQLKIIEPTDLNNNRGFRKPQRAALFAALCHLTSAPDRPATIVMPTGTGKTDAIFSCHGAALWSQCGVGIRAPLEGRHIGASPRAA